MNEQLLDHDWFISESKPMTLFPRVFDLLLYKLVKISSGRSHNIFHTLQTKDYLKIDFEVLIIICTPGGGLSNTNDRVARRKF